MSRIAFAVLCTVALAGTGAGAPKDACVKVFQRQRACTDTFIPALVDLRVELDKPAGIAARAKAEGRQALINAALEEWKEDSKDEAIGKTCDRITANPKAGPMFAASEKCVAQATCGAFVECVIPLMRQQMR